MIITRTFFVKLELTDEPPEAIAQQLHSDLLQLGYAVVQIELKDSIDDSTAFNTSEPQNPF